MSGERWVAGGGVAGGGCVRAAGRDKAEFETRVGGVFSVRETPIIPRPPRSPKHEYASFFFLPFPLM